MKYVLLKAYVLLVLSEQLTICHGYGMFCSSDSSFHFILLFYFIAEVACNSDVVE